MIHIVDNEAKILAENIEQAISNTKALRNVARAMADVDAHLKIHDALQQLREAYDLAMRRAVGER